MNRNVRFGFVLALLVAAVFTACEEIPPVVTPVQDQGECPLALVSTVANQQRNILIEEFTGVRCVNCPAGAQAIEALLAQHGNRLVAFSIHAGFFAPPYAESRYDFRTSAGNQLLSLLGEPIGYPTAVVNRRRFPGEFSMQLGQSKWAGYVQQELTKPLKVKIALNSNFNAGTRELEVAASLYVEQSITEPDVRLSIVLLEDNVVDYQLTPAGKQADYVHKHILRSMLTSADGNLIQEDLNAGSRFCKKFVTTVPEAWKASDMKIAAIVSLGGPSKEVLQVVQVKMVP
jgi:hypothetical protein